MHQCDIERIGADLCSRKAIDGMVVSYNDLDGSMDKSAPSKS